MQLINSNRQKFNTVILAGGEGTRLFGKKNKSKLKILSNIGDGKVFFDYLYHYLKKNEFNKILILAGFNGDKIKKYLQTKKFKAEVSVEKYKKGTGGAIIDNLHLLEENFLVILGDIYTELNLKKFFNIHKKFKSISSTILCHSNDHFLDSNLAIKDSNGLLKKIIFKNSKKKKFIENLAFSGIYFFKKKDLYKLKFKKKIIDLENDIIQYLIRIKKKIKVIKFNDFLIDFGTKLRMKILRKILRNKKKIYKKNYFFLPDSKLINIKKIIINLKKFKFQINILITDKNKATNKSIIYLESELSKYNLYFNDIIKLDLNYIKQRYMKRNNVQRI